MHSPPVPARNSCAPRPPAAQRLLPGADLALRHARGYQRIRLTVLTVSVAIVVLGPLWVRLFGENLLVGAPFTVRLAGVELLDPVAAAVALASSPRTVLAVLVGVAPTLALVAIFGRFFCGWLCPYLPVVAASNATRFFFARFNLRLPDVKLPRGLAFGVLAAVLLGAALLGVHLTAWVYPPAVIARLALGGSGAALVLGFAFDAFVSRAGFCRSLCPGGALFSLLGRTSPVKLTRDAKACTDCTACDFVCNMGQLPMTDRVDSGCDRCGKCVSVCPTDALKLRWSPK